MQRNDEKNLQRWKKTGGGLGRMGTESYKESEEICKRSRGTGMGATASQQEMGMGGTCSTKAGRNMGMENDCMEKCYVGGSCGG